MNEINTNKTTAHKKRRYILLYAAIFSGIALISLAVYHSSHNKKPKRSFQNKNQIELNQYAILAPTNAIIKNYLVDEGELIAKSSATVMLIDPLFEARIQKALTKVSNARLNLEEKRIENISATKKITPSANRSALQNRIQIKRNQRSILNQKELVHKLSVALSSFQAKLVNLNSQPFGNKAENESINAIKADITKFQGKLDMANVELKQLQDAANIQLAKTGTPVQNNNKITAITRSIEIAEQQLKYEENLLKIIQQQEPQFSTIIPAPFSGLIIENILPENSYVREGQPILIMLQQDY